MKRICVFAGSSRGLGPEYVNAAKSLGRDSPRGNSVSCMAAPK